MGFCKPHWGSLLRYRPVWCSRGSGVEGVAQHRTESIGLYHVTSREEGIVQAHLDCSIGESSACHYRTPNSVWRTRDSCKICPPPVMRRSSPALLGDTMKTSLSCLLSGRRPHGCIRHMSHVTVRPYSLYTPTNKFRVRTTCCDRRICCGAHTLPEHDISCRQTQKLHPPWNVMFFGTDDFSLESLKILHKYSLKTEAIVGRLEVVCPPCELPKGFPVANYATDHGLRIHLWPNVGNCDQFDVGVVASFGRLLGEGLILKFPYGILNVHPSLLPRWRGPAPIIYTVLNGDEKTGVTIMQIRPKRFDVGPIVMQETIPVPTGCTSMDLEIMLSKHGAEMLISVLKDLPRCLSCAKEQPKEGVTTAPKISAALSCIRWEEQTPTQIIQLERAISFVMPLQTVWMGKPIKVLDFTEVPDSMIRADFSKAPGTLQYLHQHQLLVVRCKDGWVGVRAVKLKKKISARDFYNAYLQPYVKKATMLLEECRFTTLCLPAKPKPAKQKPASM